MINHITRTKIVITFGIIAPSLCRAMFPDFPSIEKFANLVMVLTAVMWVWEI